MTGASRLGPFDSGTADEVRDSGRLGDDPGHEQQVCAEQRIGLDGGQREFRPEEDEQEHGRQRQYAHHRHRDREVDRNATDDEDACRNGHQQIEGVRPKDVAEAGRTAGVAGRADAH